MKPKKKKYKVKEENSEDEEVNSEEENSEGKEIKIAGYSIEEVFEKYVRLQEIVGQFDSEGADVARDRIMAICRTIVVFLCI